MHKVENLHCCPIGIDMDVGLILSIKKERPIFGNQQTCNEVVVKKWNDDDVIKTPISDILNQQIRNSHTFSKRMYNC